jgi:hypothetical protein
VSQLVFNRCEDSPDKTGVNLKEGGSQGGHELIDSLPSAMSVVFRTHKQTDSRYRLVNLLSEPAVALHLSFSALSAAMRLPLSILTEVDKPCQRNGTILQSWEASSTSRLIIGLVPG